MSAAGGLLVYLYGPPASGKLTVAEALVAQTGFRLFHNHLTVDALTPLFDRHSEEFRDVLHRLRLDVFATAAAAGLDVVFTNNSAWAGSDGRERFEDGYLFPPLGALTGVLAPRTQFFTRPIRS